MELDFEHECEFPSDQLDYGDAEANFAAFWYETIAPVLYQNRRLHTTPKIAVCNVCGKLFLFPDPRQSCCTNCRLRYDRHSNPKHDRHTSRQTARAAHHIEFVGIDGEGVNIFDEAGIIVDHKYVLLSATGCPPLMNNAERLTTQEILHYLYYTVFKNNPDGCFVGFSLKYDFSQWLRDLPRSRAKELFTKEGIQNRKRKSKNPAPHPMYWRNPSAHSDWRAGDDTARPNCEWEIDFLGDKRVKVRPYTGPHRPHERGIKLTKNENRWMYINDAFSFFQCTFVKAIDPETRRKVALERESVNMWNGTTAAPELPVYLTTKEDYELIVAGKKRRGADAPFDKDMMQYNAAELRILAALMREVNQGLNANHVRLKRSQFFGPGQAAQACLDHCAKIPVLASLSSLDEYRKLAFRLPMYIAELARLEAEKIYHENPSPPYIHFSGKNVREHVPEWFREAARKSYYGGRFELFYHGILDGVAYEYDINSAYPTVMTQLPCLFHGQYIQGKGSPYRSTRALPQDNGFGTRPGQTLCLVYADVKGTHPRIGALPFRFKHNGGIIFPQRTIGWYWLHEIEAARHAGCIDTVRYVQWWAYVPCDCPPPLAFIGQLYQDRIALGKEGKGSPNGVGKKLIYNSAYGKKAQSVGDPKYGNPIYASLITAGCRWMIFDAIATHPGGANAVLNIATDGIWFASPHPHLELHKTKLGAWDMTERHNPMLFKPGTYWDDAVREKVRTYLDHSLPGHIRDAALGSIKMKSRGVPIAAAPDFWTAG
jgi:hypothetical protein